MTTRTQPPGLEALAEAVARYQAQQQASQGRRTRTTRETAIRAGKAASGPAIAVAIAVALSQAIQGFWGSDIPEARDRVREHIEAHDAASAAHKTELDKLRSEVALCKASIERIELELQAPDAVGEAPQPRRGVRKQ